MNEYFVTQVRVSTHRFVETGDDERESEQVYRGWTQISADTFDDSVPQMSVELKTLFERDVAPLLADGGVVEGIEDESNSSNA